MIRDALFSSNAKIKPIIYNFQHPQVVASEAQFKTISDWHICITAHTDEPLRNKNVLRLTWIVLSHHNF